MYRIEARQKICNFDVFNTLNLKLQTPKTFTFISVDLDSLEMTGPTLDSKNLRAGKIPADPLLKKIRIATGKIMTSQIVVSESFSVMYIG